MIRAIRIVEFDAGHRVMNHESKCQTLHGHRYKVELYAAPKTGLDEIGRVIDFGVLKQIIGGWIDDKWDHTTLVYDKDTVTLNALRSIPRFKEPFVCGFNPTAENMADYLLREICPGLLAGEDIVVDKIRIWETPNCYVEATL